MVALRDRIAEHEHTSQYVTYSCPECSLTEVQRNVEDAAYLMLRRMREHVDKTDHHPLARIETHAVQEFQVD